MVTIDEIAKISQVSTSTVSKALNGYREISEKTRLRVMEVAERLGYTPNATAQSLVRKRSNTIGIVYEVEYGLKNLFFTSILESFRRNVESKGYDILLLSHNTDSGLDYLRHCNSKNVDAVLVVSGGDKLEALKKLYESDLAVLTLDPKIQGKNTIYSNSYQSIKKSCKYLHDLGHRKIAYINGSYTNYIGQERLRGYLDFMLEKNLEPIYMANHSNESYTFDEGYKNMKALFETYGLPEAVCASSDLMAVGAITYLQKHGYNVPNDVSVIGFDDIQVCEIVTPRLTTIRQDYEVIGSKACDILLSMIHDKIRDVEPVEVETDIIVRESCKKLNTNA
ncbi:MAG: LacI family DNA-binding transcriptional regulator [Acholeplasmataceae bacterium]|jgi:LacI family transcriptional regulator|nr:LacI family DNA-binding transcriptional regulator [Acholeplasmataceae bacterium]